MYFFKADISSFDDEAETVFIIPEQNADENGVPFEEKMITQTAEYKAFVKRTKTALVDCTYTQYQTDEPIADGLNSEKFAQLEAEGKFAVIDVNTYSISTGKSAKSKGKKNFTTYLIIGGIAVVAVIKNQVKYIDGSYEKYTTKFLKPDIAELKFGKISSKAYTGKAMKPTVIVKDGKKKLVNGTDYTVTYNNNKNIGTAAITITGIGEYRGTKTLKFKIVPPKTTLTSKPGKTSGGWNRATLSWKKSAGADGYQIYYSENGGNFKKLTTVSYGKLSRSVIYTTGYTEQFKARPYKKVNGKTYFGAWSNIITLN